MTSCTQEKFRLGGQWRADLWMWDGGVAPFYPPPS